MTYCIKIEHTVRGLSDSRNETVFFRSCEDTEKDFECMHNKQLQEAKEKFLLLSKEYKKEVFRLILIKYEDKVLDETIIFEEA